MDRVDLEKNIVYYKQEITGNRMKQNLFLIKIAKDNGINIVIDNKIVKQTIIDKKVVVFFDTVDDNYCSNN